jgi:hypothetical protein
MYTRTVTCGFEYYFGLLGGVRRIRGPSRASFRKHITEKLIGTGNSDLTPYYRDRPREMTIVPRALMPLWIGAVCLVAVGARVAAVSPATAAAIARSAVNCETPTDLTMVPASNSEAASLREIEAWWEQKEALSQMEAWWRERTEQRAATASLTALRTTTEAIAQMEAWWRQRGKLRNPAGKRVLPAQHRRQFVGPNDPGSGGPVKSIDRRALSDDELSAIGMIRQR